MWHKILTQTERLAARKERIVIFSSHFEEKEDEIIVEEE
jgi:hypothetical protein